MQGSRPNSELTGQRTWRCLGEPGGASAGLAGPQPCTRCTSGHRPCPPHQSSLCSLGQSSCGGWGPTRAWTHCRVSRAEPTDPWAQAPWLASWLPESSEKEPGTRLHLPAGTGGTRGIPPLVRARALCPEWPDFPRPLGQGEEDGQVVYCASLSLP